MDKKMFCFQCEQTVGCTGCTGNAGVCGKKADTAKLQDELTGALISLAKAADSTETISKRTGQIIIEGLFTTVTNVSFDNAAIENMIQKVRAEKERLAPDCRTEEYDLQQLWNANEDIRSLKSLILFGIRGMAAYAYHANVLNYEDAEVNQFFCEALSKIGYEESTEALLSTVLKTGEINLKCMALLDKANTETYGTPEPTDVTLTVEKGPFIVVTGHDLKDLQLLLEQTEGKGINIYTHGEMLPAHAYPFLKKYAHLKGNFGTAWQNQQKEFDHLPAPILYTTNCLMPPKSSYADRVFTTEVVAFPGAVHIDEKKDFGDLCRQLVDSAGCRRIGSFKQLAGMLKYPTNMRTGRYAVEPGMNNLALLNNLRRGHQEATRITFNNIRFKLDLAERLAGQLMIEEDDLLPLLVDSVYCASLGFTTETILALFIPNTYEVYWNISAEKLMQRMQREYKIFWNDVRLAKAKEIGMTPVEVAILASIVEEETAAVDEYPIVAGLYINRLQRGIPLQADPTVKFAVGDFSLQRILFEHLEIDSPYNTYKHAGLPPGPLRIPTIRGLDAVLNHMKHNYLYMCAKEDFSGRHNFAVTLAEHNRNANRYRAELNRRKIR